MADLLRVSITGIMPGGEEWSTNPVYSIGGDFGAPVSAQQAQTIATAIAAIAVPTALLQANIPGVTVSGCRVEARNMAGVLESQAEALKTTPTAGSGTSQGAYQSALVISLRTPHAGGSGRGRLYWPATGLSLQAANLRPSAAVVTSFLSGAKTYLSGIQAAIDVSLDGVALGVWSRKLLDVYTVNSIQVGDVVDTQRRRRDQLVENYQSVTYP